MKVTDAELHAACLALDDVWEFFAQINIQGVPGRRWAAVLREGKRRGLIDSRRDPIYGRVEYAITPEGDRFVGRA